MNTSPIPSLADRLKRVGTGRLCVRLGLARTNALNAHTEFGRRKANDEIRAILAELSARGEATCD